MAWESVPPASQLRCHLLPRYGFFTARLRGAAATTPATTARGPPPQPTQEGRLRPRLEARKPPGRRCLFPSAPTPAAAIACISGHKFFSSFFRFFSDHCRDLFSPHAGFSNPPPLHRASPLKPASPAAAIASFAGTQVKLCFFSSFFRFFSDQCCRDLFSPHAGFSNPPPLHRASPLKPRKSRRRHCPIRGHASKVMFISFLFFSFLL